MPMFPPQTAPVRRPDPLPPYTTIGLHPPTAEHLDRVRVHLTYSANVNDPAAYTLPGYEQAKLSAR
ncbi:cyanobactin biosynthesis protein (PatB/AcyB/McaB family) [Streptosporangium becharense]|uniref:Cyanobactin biosynthesis protein (PatB/AcyB/McaB family) n=1 Tax=Streptosporangium becharense TaxID=1816182 RepID=A0A7W9IBA3_9ACTN|nr:cyanobactin biosynthesis system PatB/AcyB/McaB family protein [Streptosporangium becharense]MBB2915319.1 cyanobactin biosynthesis protein (PatB/AcyB/McaB family) [Streptosporangium becharense]MBB5816983.1 cyanobactin biosynthesis protein (PatB/AcyB/McaB family) [Streptosporangium becharense]